MSVCDGAQKVGKNFYETTAERDTKHVSSKKNHVLKEKMKDNVVTRVSLVLGKFDRSFFPLSVMSEGVSLCAHKFVECQKRFNCFFQSQFELKNFNLHGIAGKIDTQKSSFLGV
jgi:hypothetical protein